MTSARGQKGGVELAASHRAKPLGLDLPGRAGKRVWPSLRRSSSDGGDSYTREHFDLVRRLLRGAHNSSE